MYDFWQKRVWVPCWVIQLIAGAIFAISGGVAMAASNALDDNKDNIDTSNGLDGKSTDEVAEDIDIAGIILLVLGTVTVIFNLIEIILFARRRLHPWVGVVLGSLSVIIWGVIFVGLIINAVRSTGNTSPSIVDWILGVALLFTSATKLIYSSVTLHRYRNGDIEPRGAYTPAHPHAGLANRTTAYGAPQANPLRDPSRDSSPAPPPFKAYGAANDYYDPPRTGPEYEMQQQQPLVVQPAQPQYV